MALGTSLLALALGSAGYVPNVEQNQDVLSIMHHCFSTIPGALWILTAFVLFYYKLNKHTYNRIVTVINYKKNK